ncbi:hypothetical protein PTQ21_13205 [Paenibacillus marchantiae]|uniref:hypothetical protein n=1 Tax=Paenibacillus marchantiae TaxID=3026433 RepID=UPI00237B0F27|nr:hypothetical protein [Paenibacillus marchantiae]WDQ35128.1 hypothetical protein PTQ21_13205 [Paenibacillus marchantiae]
MINNEYYVKLNQDAQEHYQFYKQQAEALVDRREYTTSKRYDISPYWYARQGEIPGDISDEETDTYYEFDEEGRIRILACDDLIDGYTYVTYADGVITTRTYVDGELDSVKEYLTQDGLVCRSVEYFTRFNKLEYEDYIYEGNRLVEVYQPQYENNDYFVHLLRTYFEYDEQGVLLRVLDGTQGVIYVLMSSEEVFVLRESVKKGLILALKEIVGALCEKQSNKTYCFLSIYLHDEVHTVYSPIFHPGWQEVREEQIEEKDEDEDYYYRIWSSGEHPVNDQQELMDHDLIQKLRTLIMYWRSIGDWWEEGMSLWKEVAYDLNETTNWSAYSGLTENFVVFVEWKAMDVMNGDLQESIPSAKLEVLQSEGIAPRI